MRTWSTARAFRSWPRRSPAARSAADLLGGLSLGGLGEDAAPEAHVLALVADPALERQAHAIRHPIPSQHLLVGREPALVAFELGSRQGRGIGSAEELQQTGGAKLVHVRPGTGAPSARRLAARCRETVDHATPPPLLPLLVEEIGIGQASALG